MARWGWSAVPGAGLSCPAESSRATPPSFLGQYVSGRRWIAPAAAPPHATPFYDHCPRLARPAPFTEERNVLVGTRHGRQRRWFRVRIHMIKSIRIIINLPRSVPKLAGLVASPIKSGDRAQDGRDHHVTTLLIRGAATRAATPVPAVSNWPRMVRRSGAARPPHHPWKPAWSACSVPAD